jgi:DNA-binding transcriptional LysR family regulator
VSKSHPGIQFEIFDDTEEQNDIVRMVGECKVDIALARGMDDKVCVTRPFFADEYLLVVPATLEPLPHGDVYRRLEELNFIQHDNSCARIVTQQLRDHGFAPRVFRNIGSTHSVIASISSGMGYSILPRLALAQCQGNFRTMALPQPVSRDFSVISRPSSLLSAAANCVLKYVRDQKLIQNIARRH